jgi:pimeloyl-ACP methyl ester carboxylesterase
VALAFAEIFPEKLSALGLFHSTAKADTAAKIAVREKAIQFIQEHGAAAFLRTSIPGLFKNPENHQVAIQLLLERSKTLSANSLIIYYRMMMARPNRQKIIAQLEQPFLLVAGSYDQAVPLEDSLEQAALANCTQLNFLKESAHMGMYEEREASVGFLANFLQFVSSRNSFAST